MVFFPCVYFFKMAQMPASVGPNGLPTVELGLDDGQALTAVRPPVCIIVHTRRTYINDFAQAEQVIFRDIEIYTNHDGSHCDVPRQHISFPLIYFSIFSLLLHTFFLDVQ